MNGSRRTQGGVRDLAKDNVLAVLSLAFLVAVILGSVAAPWLAPYGPLETDFGAALQGPSASHLLGTDSLGRDVLSRLMYAGDSALGLVLVAIGVALILAVPVGVFVGLVGGWADALVARVADIVLSIPTIIVLLMVLAMFDQSMVAAMVAVGVLYSPRLMRVARAAAIAESQEPYIAAARVSGLTQLQISIRHVLPRVLGPIVVNTSVLAAGALLAQTGLTFLGLGTHPPAPTWGGLIADASSTMQRDSWMLVPTGGVVALSITALVLLGDSFRDALTARWAGSTRVRAPRASRSRSRSIGLDEFEPQPRTVSGRPPDDVFLRVERLVVATHTEDGDGLLPIVSEVTFDIRRGETVGLVGESGCGKTMTGLAILGLLPPAMYVAGGRIAIDGVDVATMTRRERRALRGSSVAFVSQEPMAALDPLFTIGAQLDEAVRAHTRCTRRQSRDRTLQLLESVQLPDPARIAGLYPHQVSGGMAQRVAIAIALAGGPSLLIADEPTTALDVTVQAEILQLLSHLQNQTGMAMLLISHDWGVVAETCDRCLVMYAGQVVEADAVSRMLVRPLHPYTDALLAADPHLAEPGQVLATIVGAVPRPGEWPDSCRFQSRCPHVIDACTRAEIPLVEAESGHLTRCVRSDLLAAGAPK